MNEEDVASVLFGLLDELAALEHERWSHWQRHLHGKGRHQDDGSLVLPAEVVARWERQMATTFEDLSDDEKESDRDQVRRYLPLILSALARRAT